MDRPGFATGLLTGLGLGIGLMFLLATAFPPFVLTPPDIDEAIRTPPAPGLPEIVTDAEPRLPAPLLPGPAAGLPTETLRSLAPQVAPDVFEGNPAGSPSLVPAN